MKTKYQIVESQSTQVRQRYMKCDTQLLYGTSGPTVSEDGSRRASDTCALQGYVQMCMRSTLCSGDRHTTGIATKKARDKLGIILCSNTAHVTVAWRRSCDHTIPRQQGTLRLTHLQCSQLARSKNQVRVTSSHAADSVTFAERVQEFPSPDHRKRYTGVVITVLRYSNVLHLRQHVCHVIGDTMVRTSRFTRS